MGGGVEGAIHTVWQSVDSPNASLQLLQLLWDGRPDTVADGYPCVVFDYLCMSSGG